MIIGLNGKAETSFKTCLNLNPNYEPALFNLAKVYQNKKKFKKSNEMLMKFIKIKVSNTAAYLIIASNNLMIGENDKAKILYKKVIDLKPDNLIALTNLAKIYFSLEKKEISRSYIERALKLNLSKTQANELNQLLKKF